MEVIRKGNYINESPKEIECLDCLSILAITMKDIRFDADSARCSKKSTVWFATCPVCQERIPVEHLWKPPTHPYR